MKYLMLVTVIKWRVIEGVRRATFKEVTNSKCLSEWQVR